MWTLGSLTTIVFLLKEVSFSASHSTIQKRRERNIKSHFFPPPEIFMCFNTGSNSLKEPPGLDHLTNSPGNPQPMPGRFWHLLTEIYPSILQAQCSHPVGSGHVAWLPGRVGGGPLMPNGTCWQKKLGMESRKPHAVLPPLIS